MNWVEIFRHFVTELQRIRNWVEIFRHLVAELKPIKSLHFGFHPPVVATYGARVDSRRHFVAELRLIELVSGVLRVGDFSGHLDTEDVLLVTVLQLPLDYHLHLQYGNQRNNVINTPHNVGLNLHCFI